MFDEQTQDVTLRGHVDIAQNPGPAAQIAEHVIERKERDVRSKVPYTVYLSRCRVEMGLSRVTGQFVARAVDLAVDEKQRGVAEPVLVAIAGAFELIEAPSIRCPPEEMYPRLP